MDSQTSDIGAALPEWTCNRFELSLDDDEVPEILRRVATVIERIDGFRLLDIAVMVCPEEEEATASVYYRIGPDERDDADG